PSSPTLFPYTTLFRSHNRAVTPTRRFHIPSESNLVFSKTLMPLFWFPGPPCGYTADRTLPPSPTAGAVIPPVSVPSLSAPVAWRSEEHTSELQSRGHL